MGILYFCPVDKNLMSMTGKVLMTCDLARRYGILDVDGKTMYSYIYIIFTLHQQMLSSKESSKLRAYHDNQCTHKREILLHKHLTGHKSYINGLHIAKKNPIFVLVIEEMFAFIFCVFCL